MLRFIEICVKTVKTSNEKKKLPKGSYCAVIPLRKSNSWDLTGIILCFLKKKFVIQRIMRTRCAGRNQKLIEHPDGIFLGHDVFRVHEGKIEKLPFEKIQL